MQLPLRKGWQKVLPCCWGRFAAGLLALSLLFAWQSGAQAHIEGDSPVVLVIHSFNVDYPWTNSIHEGMLEILTASGLDPAIHTEYMDTMLIDSKLYLELLAEEYKLKYTKHKPDVILISDDNALEFITQYRDEISPGIPVVFCGINSYQGRPYLQDKLDTGYMTGVVEQIEIEANLELVLKLHPNVKRILLFTDDSIPGSRNYINAKHAIGKIDTSAEIVLRNDLALEDVVALAPDWGPGDVRIDISTLRNEAGVVLSHAESCRRICAASKIPTYSCWSYMLDTGVVGGKMVDGASQGRTAANKVLAILRGATVDSIPIDYESPNKYIFEIKQLDRFNLSARALPRGSVVRNQPETLFQQYPMQSSLGLILLMILVVVVIVLSSAGSIRLRADRQLAMSEERLRLAMQNIPVMLYANDEKGNTIVWNRECEQITGYSWEEIVDNPDALRLLYPEQSIRDRILEMRRERPGDVYNWELPLTCKDGRIRIISTTNASAQYPVPGWASWGIGIDVTARKHAEQQLQQSRSHYYRLVTLAQEGIVSVNEEEAITFANPAFCNLLGYEPHELLGRSFLELCEPSSRERIKDESEQRRRRSVSVYEATLQTRYGEQRDFLISANPLFDSNDHYEGSLGVFTDITQLKLAQEALHQSERNYRQLMDSLPVGVVVVVSGRIVFCNASAIAMLGASSAEQVLQMPLAAIVPSSQQEQWEKWVVQTGDEDGISPVEIQLQRLDGARLDVEVEAAPIAYEQQPGVQLLVTDIRERKQLFEKLIQQQKEESIVTLAGGLAHDFNNILLGIIGAVNLLSQSSELPEEDLELCNIISTSAERMAELTKKLLAFARGDRIQPQRVEVQQVVDNALLMSRGSLPVAVELEIGLASNLWPVLADPAQLEQVLMNLVINASEAMSDTGGRIMITAVNQTLVEDWSCSQHTQHPAGSYVLMKVADTGPGMDEETQRRIFDPFFSTKFQGRGLGLAVAAGIIRAHSGCLTVSSKTGHGSTFSLLLPRAEQEADTTKKPERKAYWGVETILIIDDEEHTLRLTTRMLGNNGYKVLAGLGGMQGLDVFKHQSGAIDLVILDRGIQRVTVFDLLQEIRRLRPDLPVVICSGHSQDEALTGFERLGPLVYLAKPYQANDLYKVIRDTLDNRDSEST